MFLACNWNAFKVGGLPLGFGPLWSVSVEERFYLAWPTSMLIASMQHESLNHTWCNSLNHGQYLRKGHY